MHLIEFGTITTSLLNVFGILFVHLGIAWVMIQKPVENYNPDAFPWAPLPGERGGKIWDDLFRVKSWKKLLPDGAAWFSGGFSKKSLQNRDPEYLKRFLLETCRGEKSHWLMIACAPVFAIWNPPIAFWIIAAYFVIGNMPCIIVQRFNRPFLKRLASRKPS
jgi:glycosyl-4,4'-diaponeurosporenoate acyltransferase